MPIAQTQTYLLVLVYARLNNGAKMKKHACQLVLFFFLFAVGITACKNKSSEERLSEINLNEETYKLLDPCEQINVFAEIGSGYLDIGHMFVNMPNWVYQIIENNEKDINSNCIETQILKYFSDIEQDKDLFNKTSLKIHSLFYLSDFLNLLRDPNINYMLKTAVCEKRVLYFERLIAPYYFTQKMDLPAYIVDSKSEDLPENMEKLRLEICGNS